MHSCCQGRQLKVYAALLKAIQIGFIKIIQDKILTIVVIQGRNNIMANACTGRVDPRRIAELHDEDRVFICNAPAYKLLIVQIGFYHRTLLVIVRIRSKATYNEIGEIAIRITASIFSIQTELPISELIIYVLRNLKAEGKLPIY